LEAQSKKMQFEYFYVQNLAVKMNWSQVAI